jgi:ERCC4-type nuclease
VARPVVIVDTREQAPYLFSDGRVATVRGTLPAGDYSLQGLEGRVVVERKSANDLANTLSTDRERWVRELEKLRGYRFAALVVECCRHDLLAHRYESPVQPGVLLGRLHETAVKYGVHVYFAGDRAGGEQATQDFLLRAARVLEEEQASE